MRQQQQTELRNSEIGGKEEEKAVVVQRHSGELLTQMTRCEERAASWGLACCQLLGSPSD